MMIRGYAYLVFYIGFLILFFQISSCKNKAEHIVRSEKGIEVYENELSNYIDVTHEIETLADGFVWSEGPVWVKHKNILLFTDVPQNIIYEWSEKGGLKEWLRPSGYTGINSDGGQEGANGLAIAPDGGLILCQHGDRRVVKFAGEWEKPQAEFQELAGTFEGQRFNSPNDLFIDDVGQVFFTDPPYGLPKQDDDPSKEISFNGIYVLKSDGNVQLIDSTMSRPNGLALSSSNNILYVANSDSKKAMWMKFVLDKDYNVVSKSIFADKTPLLKDLKGLPDGLKIHPSGLIFATGPGGVLIFHPDGRHLGTILTGKATANCAFDGDFEYLYMTAHDQLMRVRLK